MDLTAMTIRMTTKIRVSKGAKPATALEYVGVTMVDTAVLMGEIRFAPMTMSNRIMNRAVIVLT